LKEDVCFRCGKVFQEKMGNLSFRSHGIEVVLVGARFKICGCEAVTLPADVKMTVNRFLREKENFPNSPRTLYIDMAHVISKGQ
jgi:hypothetical protein